MNYKVIGQRIKEKRKKSRKTQDDLAEALCVSVGYISQIERGATKISLDTLSSIAVLLECDLSELITGSVPKQPQYLREEIETIYCRMNETQKTMLLEIANAIVKY